MSKRKILDKFLETQVKRALGCTEPIAVALASAYARSAVGGEVRKIEVLVDPNIFKNGMGAGIPGTSGRTGNIIAAALGALCGDPSCTLEVLENIDGTAIEQADKLIDRGSVVIEVLRGRRGLFIDARVITARGLGRARIENSHTNLTILERNGESILNATKVSEDGGGGHSLFDGLCFADLFEASEEVSEQELELLLRAVRTNEAAARYGIENKCGLGLGYALQQAVENGFLGNDAANLAQIMTAAAVDARMGGAPVPVSSVAGSGNQGLACVLPLLAFCRSSGIEDDKRLAQAAALSFLVTGYIKSHTGSLGAMCGCVVAAGTGAAAGIARLMGGDVEFCARAVTNCMVPLAGVICDGAKGSCSLKLATAATSAVQAAVLAKEGVQISEQDGITGSSVDDTVDNLGRLSDPGMIRTDQVILDIMTDKLK